MSRPGRRRQRMSQKRLTAHPGKTESLPHVKELQKEMISWVRTDRYRVIESLGPESACQSKYLSPRPGVESVFVLKSSPRRIVRQYIYFRPVLRSKLLGKGFCDQRDLKMPTGS